MRKCLNCGKDIVGGSYKWCDPCKKLRKNMYAKERYKKFGNTLLKLGVCEECKKEIRLSRKSQRFCKDCWRKIHRTNFLVTNNYVRGGGAGFCFLHRKIATKVLQRDLKSTEMVHHVDLDIENNLKENLIILSRSSHTRLHRFLTILRYESISNNYEFSKELIVINTHTWLKSKNIPYINLADVVEAGYTQQT